MKKIYKIDQTDIAVVDKYNWYISSRGYVVASNYDKPSMHRLIMGFPEATVDHINGDKTDNRRSNLRTCTQHQNTMNCAIPVNNTSGFKGVSWNKALSKWHAYIMVRYKRKHLGYFDDIVLAAQAYNHAATEHFGEYAKLNEVIL